MQKKLYSPPTVEVFDVHVEKGFASTTYPINEWNQKQF